MQNSNIPAKFPVTWASGATSTYVRAIPQTTVDPNAASLQLGYPPATFIARSAGGAPPDGRDENGILQQLTAWQQWQQAGAPITYDATFQAAIGGYPKGAIVASAATFGVWWLSTTDNNTTNPDTGGAGWVSVFGGRLLNVRAFLSSTTYTPTPGMQTAFMDVTGGGGGGGGCPPVSGGQASGAGGGGQGGHAIGQFTAAEIGASQPVTIGAGGAGGAIGAHGTAGGTSSVGTLISASGGGYGSAGIVSTNSTITSAQSGSPGATTGGTIPAFWGVTSFVGQSFFGVQNFQGSNALGGTSAYGVPGGGEGSGQNASAGTLGSGGGGASNVGPSPGYRGGAGGPGPVIIWELS